MNYLLFDDSCRDSLLPLTFTRPVADLRVGILTIKEKWDICLKGECHFWTVDHLGEKFPAKIEDDNLFINGSLFPDNRLVKKACSLKLGQCLLQDGLLLAARLDAAAAKAFQPDSWDGLEVVSTSAKLERLVHPHEIFLKNGAQIEFDFRILTRGRRSQKISDTNRVANAKNIFIEEGAVVEFATLNANDGFIYIGENAEVMEGCLVRGSLALCQGASLKMGAKIYGPTTVGPYCKVGGELNNVVLHSHSNKAHDGFLGNAVIGQWCNLGADSNNSNLKNNYEEVRMWSYPSGRFEPTGLQFCGLVMGDHSKCGINTMFNTGTVVGVSANIFGPGFPRNFIPSFSWGGASGFTTYALPKALRTAELVLARRGIALDEVERRLLERVFELTRPYRS